MRSPSQRGRTLVPGAKRLMRNREDGERGAAGVRSRTVRGRQRREAPSPCPDDLLRESEKPAEPSR